MPNQGTESKKNVPGPKRNQERIYLQYYHYQKLNFSSFMAAND